MQVSEQDVWENENRGLERLRREVRLDVKNKRKAASMLKEDAEGRRSGDGGGRRVKCGRGR